jgi:hypothetical protein
MLAKDADLGIMHIEDYREEKERFDEWIRKAQRYRNGINKRLSEVKTILASSGSLDLVEENARLAKAIIEHRRASFEGEYTAETHDLKLWSSVASD